MARMSENGENEGFQTHPSSASRLPWISLDSGSSANQVFGGNSEVGSAIGLGVEVSSATIKEEAAADVDQVVNGSLTLDGRQWPFEAAHDISNYPLSNDVLQGVLFGCNSTNQTQRQKIERMLERASNATSQKAVNAILDEIEKLPDRDKLMLYYKLPLRRSSDVDPLRMPLNPLGSRPEIQQTIVWIQTHLEEDADISLPKHEVYEEYTAYCSENNVKPLSTADFGKVMKQVFPTVKPRRLGTRGHSRYCYSGLRKKIELEKPLLPDLTFDGVAESVQGGNGVSEIALEDAACVLVKEWAEKLLGIQVSKMANLASYLVEKLYVDQRSKAVMTWTKLTGLHSNDANLTGSAFPENVGKCPEITNDKDREHIRELKRKLQEQQNITSRRYSVQNRQNKKTKVSAAAQGGPESHESDRETKKSQRASRKTKAKATTPPTEVQAPPTAEPHDSQASKNGELLDSVKGDAEIEALVSKSANKVAIPRLHASPRPSCTAPAIVLLPGLNQTNGGAGPGGGGSTTPKQKYVPIQPKPSPSVSPSADGAENTPAAENTILDARQTDEEVANFWGVSCDSSSPKANAELSQLRVILERNLSETSGLETKKSKTLLERRNVRFETPVTSVTALNDGSVPVPANVIPPSPNTRRRAFNFTPISPRQTPLPEVPPSPGSGGGSTQLKHLLSSQTSPFVSPRQTPIPSRHNSGPQNIDTPISMVSDSVGSVASTSSDSAFVSPLNTPLSVCRSRHNSASSMLVSRARHSSGASVTLRHMPYAPPQSMASSSENPLLSATRSRHSSAGSPALPRSAPLSPLVQGALQLDGGALKRMDPRRRHVSAGTGLTNRAGYYGASRTAHSLNAALPAWGSDPLAQEIQGLLDSAGGYSNAALMRSQSVPLQQMFHLLPGQGVREGSSVQSGSQFALGRSVSYNASTTSSPYSFAETPVPNEWTDFGTPGSSLNNAADQFTELDAESLHEIISEVYAKNKEELGPCLEGLDAEVLSVDHDIGSDTGIGIMDSVHVQPAGSVVGHMNPLTGSGGETDPLSCSDTGDGFPVSDMADNVALYETEEFAAALVALQETPDLCHMVQEVEGSVAVSQSMG